MVAALPPQKRELATVLIEEGVAIQDIIEEVGCSCRTIFNYKSNIKNFGDPLSPSISKVGRPPTLTTEMIDVYYFSILIVG